MGILSSHLLTIIGFLLAILLIARIMREQRNPGSTAAWLLAIMLIPYLGIPFYLIFGGRKVKRLMSKKGQIYPETPKHEIEDKGHIYNTEKILTRGGAAQTAGGNRTELLPNGETAYTRLMELLEGAKESIDITTFILGHDEVGKAVIDILTKKAQQGLKVRLILDALGCLRTKGRFTLPLRRAGGRVGVFMPMLPLHRKWSANLRNHRKIAIVDHSKAIMGGMNLASEYMGPMPDKDRWHDFNILIEGPIVSEICKIFSADWHFSTGGKYKGRSWDPVETVQMQAMGDTRAQLIASGPDVPKDPMSEAILSAILEAKKRIWIVTPYFIPDETFLKTLALLSEWGREVRIIIPSRSNHYLADLTRGSYLRLLNKSKVKIYCFDAGMLHTKLILIDDSIVIAGSANLDIRSFYLNYEIALFMYSSSQVKAIEEVLQRDILSHAHIMKREDTVSLWDAKAWVEDVCRLFSPFL